jgi:hypothetical protein
MPDLREGQGVAPGREDRDLAAAAIARRRDRDRNLATKIRHNIENSAGRDFHAAGVKRAGRIEHAAPFADGRQREWAMRRAWLRSGRGGLSSGLMGFPDWDSARGCPRLDGGAEVSVPTTRVEFRGRWVAE